MILKILLRNFVNAKYQLKKSKMKYIYCVFFAVLISCNIFKTKYVDAPIGMMIRENSHIGKDIVFIYNLDFPEKEIKNFESSFVVDRFAEGGERYGRIINGKREGVWLCGDADFDKNGKVYSKGFIWREEYFKNDLRDSIYRRFNNDGKLIYETTFKMGTGLWKEFHSNGKIYFEIQTKDGYFTDTLKLYNENGKLKEKILYIKDSLVFRKSMIIDENPTDNK